MPPQQLYGPRWGSLRVVPIKKYFREITTENRYKQGFSIEMMQ